jgi:hypothetical protein
MRSKLDPHPTAMHAKTRRHRRGRRTPLRGRDLLGAYRVPNAEELGSTSASPFRSVDDAADILDASRTATRGYVGND